MELAAKVMVDHAESGDRLVINGLDGDDTIDASAMPAEHIGLVLNGGAGNDRLTAGGDILDMSDGQDRALYTDILSVGTGSGDDIQVGSAAVRNLAHITIHQ